MPGLANKPSEEEKRTVRRVCDAFVQNDLKPKCLPEIQSSDRLNYCIDIFGKWHGRSYRFIQRHRSDRPENAEDPDFDSPFARLEYVSHDRFNVAYFRYTGQ